MLGAGEIFLALIVLFVFLVKIFGWIIAITIFTGLFTAGIKYIRYRQAYWKRQGVKGPEPHLLLGNVLSLVKGIHVADMEAKAEYGDTYCQYLFGHNDLISVDLNLIKQVMVKEFQHFPNRVVPTKKDPENDYSLLLNGMNIKENEDWKRIRSTASPAFTGSKMQKIMPIFKDCVKTMSQIIEEKISTNHEICVNDLCRAMSIDVIAKSGFGLDTNAQQEPTNEFTHMAEKFFRFSMADPLMIFSQLFPTIASKIRRYTGFEFLNNKGHVYFRNLLESMYDQRMAENDAQNILAQSFVILLAGHDTTANTLSFVLYLLAMHPDVQEKCFEEVENLIGNQDEIKYAQVKELHYINQVIQETMRLYPAAARTNRAVKGSITINGYTFQEGCSFSVPIYLIHHDNRYYPDPEKFDPDRFSPKEKAKRDPITYLPFGYGPRNCIGMRFAEFELRIAIAVLVKRFKFFPCEKTAPYPIEINTAGLTKSKDPIMLKIEKR